MIKTDINLTPQALKSDLNHFWNLSAQKYIRSKNHLTMDKAALYILQKGNMSQKAGLSGHKVFNMAPPYCSSMPQTNKSSLK